MLTLQLTGGVEVLCQRSLHPMPVQLGRRTPVLLARDAAEADAWDRETEEAEVVVADQPLDGNTLLEDEFLLSLPFSPLCDDPACAEKLQRVTGVEAPGKPNPFSVLKESKVSKTSH